MDLYHHHMPPGATTMIRRLEINYDREMNHRDEVTIRTGIEKLGETSITLLQEVWQDGRCRASAKVVECFFDPESRNAIRIPDPYRESYQNFLTED